MSFPRYERYKDSGVEWLGEVPDGWEVKPIKQIVTTPVTDGPHETPNFLEDGIPFVSAEAVSSGVLDFRKIRGFISEEDHLRFSQKYRPQLGDIYMVKSGATTGITAIVETDIDFNIWSPLAAIRCNERCLPTFILYFLRSKNFQEAITLNWSFGTQQNIGMGVIENLAVNIPSITEQMAIADFLNRETAKIENLVAKQENLIGLLKEKRQALISQAVTKGLNPDTPMKDSGIEWLGEVPKGWNLLRLGTLFSETNDQGSDQLPILTVSIHHGVSDSELDENERDRKVTRSEDRTKYKAVKPDDLVYNMMRAWQGGFGTVTVNGQVSPAYVVARPKTNFSTSFIEQVLRTPLAVEEMKRHSRGITDFRLRLYWEEFKTIEVAVPPIDEQISIMTFIAKESEKIDVLVAEAHQAIALLKERRSGLISAVVTGKIDVRGLVKKSE